MHVNNSVLNLQVRQLSSLLKLELDHISGSRIVHEESLTDLFDLVEILATLMKGPMPRRGGELEITHASSSGDAAFSPMFKAQGQAEKYMSQTHSLCDSDFVFMQGSFLPIPLSPKDLFFVMALHLMLGLGPAQQLPTLTQRSLIV